MTKYLSIALVVCLMALGISIRSCQNVNQDRSRLSDNQRSLFDSVDYYRTQSGLSAASVERLELSKSELERYCGELVETCKDLNIKVKRLQSASTTAIVSDYDIEVPITPKKITLDTNMFDEASNNAMKEALNNTLYERDVVYRTPYISINGTISNDSLKASIQTFDTIVQVVHRVPRKFWFIRWGTKAIRQEVISKNPHSNITYTEYVELKKR